MKPLGNTFSKNGFHYQLVTRHDDIAIFRQSREPNSKCFAYEVFFVKKAKECAIAGKVIEAHEAVPGNEEWGVKGWTFSTLEEARQRMRKLESQPKKGAK